MVHSPDAHHRPSTLLAAYLPLLLLLTSGEGAGVATPQGDGGPRCGHPAVPLNARVVLSSGGLAPGTIASYACDPGYELFGSPTLTCSPRGSWQGDPPFCGTNIALRRPANQSTTVRGGAAGNGNDGEATTVHDGRRCTETMKEASPWWSVDLLRPYAVGVVRVTTRGCCGHQPLKDIEIRVGNSSTDLQRNPLCAWFPGTIEEGVTKTFSCARMLVGQYVFLQLVGVEGSLSVCEVEVFTPEEFSPERCGGSSGGDTVAAFDRRCYELGASRGSFAQARAACKAAGAGGDLAHGFGGAGRAAAFLTAQLERRRADLRTQLVWIGAQREPGATSRTWRWVDGEVIERPAWGKDQPNNYNGEQNCVVLDGGRGWLWNDVGCNLDYLHWICQHTPSTCGSPDKLLNTTIEGDQQSVGSTITYRCPEGHRLVGNGTRLCAQDGFWTGTAPACQYIDCGDLDGLDHGSVRLEENRTTHGASAIYTCHENYTLIGHERRVCGDNGSWSGKKPQCLFDWCPEPPEVHGGSVEVSGQRAGSTATYTCQPGFILFGQPVLSCSLGGEWSGKAPTCKFVDCGAPPNIDNGRYNLVNKTTTHGSIVEYTCDEDYWMDGTERQTCTREGKWSADAPACVLITCEEPEVPSGSYVVGYDFNVHSTIEYHCEVGHILRGQSIHECTLNGEWSGEPPTCEYIDCGKVPPMLYGSATYVNGTTYLDSEITYSCVRNYRLVGVSSRHCLENYQWSDESPHCEEIRCPEPVLPPHSILSVTGNDRVYGRTLIKTQDSAVSVATYKIGSLVKYSCERGYKVVGEALSTCEESGQWSGEVPQCLYVNCGEPEAVAHGKYTLSSNATYYGATILYECDTNYELDGHGRRHCLGNGTWSSETPKCKEVLCSEPETDGVVTVKVHTHSIGGIARYSCPKGQYMDGNATRVCQSKGTWSGKMPTCTPVDCKHPGTIENGRVIIVNHTTTYNSAAEYHCIEHYSRIGPYLRKCMEDGSWSGEEPRCEVNIAEENESTDMGVIVGAAAGVVIILLIILGLIYLRLRKATPVKDTENIEGALRKENQNAAVMSYATLNGGSSYGMPPHNGVYENMHEHENLYDAPYEVTGRRSHYESTPIGRDRTSPVVTINGVAVR
ncbi:sushi, von Willebrand factor type A, EGF and pentraxin domain-containing protein 1 [Schistocerca americana]|uniref:sushi, von Willebrand factor type A, EGF and pentraxin domain-containing protein 1 n=1 Tax=Schistocerca americana TaxID=7009 RepID=UPI001F4F5CAA|nr:sushi, von Willebrand factor type A, EGF and pentraxin domain-containing protein 1 [Schistocerca americana]